MKSNVKKRQELVEKTADLQAMMLYFLDKLHREYGFGYKRLPELYDSVLLEMYADVSRTKAGLTGAVGDYYTRFSMDYGLTFEDYLERQKDAIRAFDEEFEKEVAEHRAACMAWSRKEREKNNA